MNIVGVVCEDALLYREIAVLLHVRIACALQRVAVDILKGAVADLHFLAPPKQAPLARCNIEVEVSSTASNEAELTVVSDQPAPFVFLSTSIRGRFSDNGMLLMPGQKHSVTSHGWEEFDVTELKKGLTVKSLRDSYK